MANKNLTRIMFDRGSSPYITGDIASFKPEIAANFVENGRAHYLDRQMSDDRPGAGAKPAPDTAETAPQGGKAPESTGTASEGTTKASKGSKTKKQRISLEGSK